MQYESTKEIWNKLVKNYEGDAKVKMAKIQAQKEQFESLRMRTSLAYFSESTRL